MVRAGVGESVLEVIVREGCWKSIRGCILTKLHSCGCCGSSIFQENVLILSFLESAPQQLGEPRVRAQAVQFRC